MSTNVVKLSSVKAIRNPRFMPLSDFPKCTCGKKAQSINENTIIDGVAWNTYRITSSRFAPILGYEPKSPLCCTCKNKASKIAKKNEGIPDDWTIAEYHAFSRYSELFPGSTIEEYRHTRKSSASEIERRNYRVIQFLQFGDEDKPLLDFITNTPIFMNKYEEIGPLSVLNDKSRATVDLHHFVTINNTSVLKSSLEPSQIVKTYLIEKSYILLTEFMGIITLNNTTHKDIHCNIPNADINTYIDSNKAPFWAESAKNYKLVQKRFPVLKSLSYTKALFMLTI